MAEMKLTQDRLKELVEYNYNTGIFYWKKRDSSEFFIKNTKRSMNTWNSRYAGKKAGTINGKGYLQFKIDNKLYLSHRLVFL